MNFPEDIIYHIIKFVDFSTLISFLRSQKKYYYSLVINLLQSIHQVLQNTAQKDLVCLAKLEMEKYSIYHSGPDTDYYSTLLDTVEYNYYKDKTVLQSDFDNRLSYGNKSSSDHFSLPILDLLKLSTTTICFEFLRNAPLQLNNTLYEHRGISGILYIQKCALFDEYRLDWSIPSQYLSPYHFIGNREISNEELNNYSTIIKYRNYLTFDRLQILANQLQSRLYLY